MTILTSVTVGTADFRHALAAVRVHASADKDVPSLYRIRLAIGRDLTITATDMYTAGLALVSIWDSDTDGSCTVDVFPDDMVKALGFFPAGKDKGDEPDYTLRLDVTADRLMITDNSGLMDGRALKIPRLPTDGGALCTIPNRIARQHDSLPAPLTDMSVSGDMLSRFRSAAVTYSESLKIEAHEGHRPLLIRCGESFLGLLMPSKLLDGDRIRLSEWADGWDARLPEIVAAADADRAETPEPVTVAAVDLDDDDRGLFIQAVEIVVRTQFAAVSLLQRRLRIGFAKALRLLDQMEQAGIVGPADGSKARAVHVPVDQADGLLSALAEDTTEK